MPVRKKVKVLYFFIFENAFHIRYTHAYDQLRPVTAMIPALEFLCCDWNGLLDSTGSSYIEVHEGYGHGKLDPDSEGILEYALVYDLFLSNTCFKKRDSHLITYRSSNTATKINFVSFRKSLLKLVMDVIVIPEEGGCSAA